VSPFLGIKILKEKGILGAKKNLQVDFYFDHVSNKYNYN
jgi:hypothetical protein